MVVVRRCRSEGWSSAAGHSNEDRSLILGLRARCLRERPRPCKLHLSRFEPARSDRLRRGSAAFLPWAGAAACGMHVLKGELDHPDLRQRVRTVSGACSGAPRCSHKLTFPRRRVLDWNRSRCSGPC